MENYFHILNQYFSKVTEPHKKQNLVDFLEIKDLNNHQELPRTFDFLGLNLKLENILGSFSHVAPELLLLALFTILIVVDLVVKKKPKTLFPTITLLGILIIAGVTLLQFLNTNENISLYLGMLSLSKASIVLKILALTSGLITVFYIISQKNTLFQTDPFLFKSEFYVAFVALLLGLHLLVLSSNLLMFYIALELTSISSYIISVFSFKVKNAEAGMKYILFGAISSAIMLYGLSLIYGFTGSLDFNSLATIGNISNTPFVMIALLLGLSGLLFKTSLFPFHIWTPDVYEGVPTPIVAFFSVAPKIASFFVVFKLLLILNLPAHLLPILAIISMASMAIGNLSAFWQNNAKRLLAYSSIAHAGFILAAILIPSDISKLAFFYYLTTYLFMNFGAFLLVDLLSRLTGSEDVNKFRGLGIKLPFIGVIFVLVMVALIGLPPTAGFYAKVFVFSALWEGYQTTGNSFLLYLFVFGIFNTVIALFYYLKIPYFMFFKRTEINYTQKINFRTYVLISLLAIPLLVLFFKPDLLTNYLNILNLNF